MRFKRSLNSNFILFFVSLAFVVLVIFSPVNVLAQVPSASCLGNCPNDEISRFPFYSTSGNSDSKSKPVNFQSAGSTPFPTVVYHDQPCHKVVSDSMNSANNSKDEVLHTKNGKKTKEGSKGKVNQGIIKVLIEILQLLLALLQELLGLSLSGTTVPTMTISPTVTLPPCPTDTPTITQIITPSLTTSPTVLLSVTPSVTSVPTSTPTATPTITSGPTPTLTVTPSVTPTRIVTTPTMITPLPTPKEAINYSGYYFHYASPKQNDSITTVFDVVGVNCGRGLIAPWAGMGDTWDVEDNLAQSGIDIDCSSGTAKYFAWTEALPAGSIYPPNTPVSEGDTISVTITYEGGGQFMTTIANSQQGWSIDTPMNYGAAYQPVGAEVINEEVGGQGVMPFSPITFDNFLVIDGGFADMALQPGLARLNMPHAVTSDLIDSAFISTYR